MIDPSYIVACRFGACAEVARCAALAVVAMPADKLGYSFRDADYDEAMVELLRQKLLGVVTRERPRRARRSGLYA